MLPICVTQAQQILFAFMLEKAIVEAAVSFQVCDQSGCISEVVS